MYDNGNKTVLYNFEGFSHRHPPLVLYTHTHFNYRQANHCNNPWSFSELNSFHKLAELRSRAEI